MATKKQLDALKKGREKRTKNIAKAKKNNDLIPVHWTNVGGRGKGKKKTAKKPAAKRSLKGVTKSKMEIIFFEIQETPKDPRGSVIKSKIMYQSDVIKIVENFTSLSNRDWKSLKIIKKTEKI